MEYFLMFIMGVLVGAVGAILLQPRHRPATPLPAQDIPADPAPADPVMQQEPVAPHLYTYDPRKRHPVRRQH